MNLTATNLYNETIFIDEYDARSAFDLEFLFPSDWHKLVERLKVDLDGELMGKLYQFYTKSASDATQCDRRCRRGLLCSFIKFRSEDPHSCDSIPE